MKLFELLLSHRVLVYLGNQRMPGKLTYAVVKNTRLMSGDVEAYQKARLAILSAHGFTDETYKADKPDKAVEAEHKALIDTEVDFKPYTVPYAMIMGIPEISPAELDIIHWMFEPEPVEE